MGFDKERFEYLIQYLNVLIDLSKADYKAYNEIKEVIEEIKKMLVL